MIRQLASTALSLATLLLFAGCGSSPRSGRPKVIVLGIDGMDPGFIETHWEALPNLDRLRRSGEFKRLRTTSPPQSPVAWSTFATGLDPAEHGIYDFVHRDPATLQPFSSFGEIEEPRRVLPLGPWLIPLEKGRVRSFRHGKTFWEILGQHGIASTILRMPANYPPSHFRGCSLAGMGTPDLLGTYGTFTLFTDSLSEKPGQVAGGRIVAARVDSHHTTLEIAGPANTLRKDRRAASFAMTVDVDPVEPAARFTVSGDQFILRQGEWSDWIRVQFPLISGVAHVSGMFRVYAAELHPGFRVYVSPLNIDPSEPALPISWPDAYSRELAQALGPYYTQGIREDTAALRAGVFKLPEFLAQSRIVFAEDLAMLRYTLDHPAGELLFFYFSSVDQDSHMLWGGHENDLVETYRRVDGAIGEVMRREPNATLIVMSDHGFAKFTRSFNVNTWLKDHGYMALDQPWATGNEELFSHVDWARTKAYSLGLNALYLNLAGRERGGAVLAAEADRLLSQISQELLQARDPANGAQIVTRVDRPQVALSKTAPDLIVGYRAGYRASWDGALGAVETRALQNNDGAWIGDHCMAPDEVPGVLFSNRRSAIADPQLKDLTVTILHSLGVAAPPEMKGRALY